MERYVLSVLAGIEAQRHYDPKSVDYGDGDARWSLGWCHEAVSLTDHFVGSNDELEAYLNLLRIRASNLIATHWQYVEAIAMALMEKKTLSAAESREIIYAVTQHKVGRPVQGEQISQ